MGDHDAELDAKIEVKTADDDKSHARRDHLIEIEKKIQKLWKKSKIYELDVKSPSKEPKYLATFPYPYMNGVLHLGHAFTLAKTEFMCRYQRLLGKKVLFPFGFHCTGMPIAACADKLKREIHAFGNPPLFDEEPEEEDKEKEKKDKDKAGDKKDEKDAKKKGKVTSKASRFKYQWNIIEEMGVSDDEISKFQNSLHWLEFFPPIAKRHLERFGLGVDWRRSFITTSVNPYYDSFIRWQFNILRKKDKIAFGKRPCIFSTADGQPCADHDRASGEGVTPQEYTLIKLEVIDELPKQVKSVVKKGQKVFLPAATLRPETMYGQTNCFVLPEGEYGIYQVLDNEVFIQSERSALNMSYQDLTPEIGTPSLLGTIKGEDLIGLAVKAPLASYDKVYVLPLLSIKMTKGTGVVTSVPSDAPDDYAALMDLKNKEPLRAKYGVEEHMVFPFEVVPIIDTPELGTTPAPKLCQEKKVQSQNDTQKLIEIKNKLYLDSFYKGVMIVGPHKGEKVSVAKPLIKQAMVDAKQALIYYEPESKVMSRSGVECVVALSDQWYLKYGEKDWKGQIAPYVEEKLNTYGDAAKQKFVHTVGWLHDWACSRFYGLGSVVPWDTQFVIESLSDSTIYMAYYTVAHLLQGGILNGSKPGPSNIKADQLTDEVWDYIFRNKEHPTYPKDCGIPKETLDQLKVEFEYWYPLDLRVSGKDLIGNHLTMAIYNHAAIWEKQPEMWPKSFFTNGHLMINAEKMSKSTGNFMTLIQAIETYGSDATRFALADAGDSLDDANFAQGTANAIILKLTKEETWIQETLAAGDGLRKGTKNFFDQVFLNQINQSIVSAQAAFENMTYHVALSEGFFKLTNARDEYRIGLGEAAPIPMHKDVVERYLEVFTLLLSPFCPHFAQHLWTIIGKVGLIEEKGRWPKADAVDEVLSRKEAYLKAATENFRSAHTKKITLMKKKDKDADPAALNAAYLYIADKHPTWMLEAQKVIKTAYADNKKTFPDSKVLAQKINQSPYFSATKKDVPRAMQFASMIRAEFEARGPAALEIAIPFDEEKFLKEHLGAVTRGYTITVEVKKYVPKDKDKDKGASPAGGKGGAASKDKDGDAFNVEVIPGEPVPYFFHK